MSVHTPVAPAPATTTHECGCGCGGRCGCETRCCDLECLVRPNFFCGQLLTDADLTAAVEWTRRRLSLSRYRDGWGIACGLHLSCAPQGGRAGCCDPADGPVVYVNPGYAVDCCGNDLVVCEPLPVDLGDVCRPEDDPCAPPKPGAPGVTKPDQTRPQTGRTGAKACWDRLKDGVFAVDLSLRYHEDLSHGQRALSGRCGDDAGCEYARVLERPCVHAELVNLTPGLPPPDRDRDTLFKAALAETLRDIAEALQGGARAVRDYLRKHPPARFCFLDDLLCCLVDLEGTSGRGNKDVADVLTRLRFWLLYDWFLQQLDCDCWSCRPDTGVPLARVYLRRSGDVRPTCSVLFIDESAPHRRLLTNDHCEAPRLDELDLRRFYWLPREQASITMERHGISLAKGTLSEAEAFAHLSKGLRFAAAGPRNLQAHLVLDPYGVERVAGFTVNS
jgi:hypothetical protein